MQALGLGRPPFDYTKAHAMAAGVNFIDATIRANNVSGLIYYTGLGFVDYNYLPNKTLAEGRKIDRTQKRFSL
jgi:hypothetical protein